MNMVKMPVDDQRLCSGLVDQISNNPYSSLLKEFWIMAFLYFTANTAWQYIFEQVFGIVDLALVLGLI